MSRVLENSVIGNAFCDVIVFILRLNVFSTFACTQTFKSKLQERKRGKEIPHWTAKRLFHKVLSTNCYVNVT
jgi:hypothetical protein